MTCLVGPILHQSTDYWGHVIASMAPLKSFCPFQLGAPPYSPRKWPLDLHLMWVHTPPHSLFSQWYTTLAPSTTPRVKSSRTSLKLSLLNRRGMNFGFTCTCNYMLPHYLLLPLAHNIHSYIYMASTSFSMRPLTLSHSIIHLGLCLSLHQSHMLLRQ